MKTLLSILLISISLSSFAQDSLRLAGDDRANNNLKSVSYYQKRLTKHPDDQDVYYSLAVSYYKLADYKTAIATWDKLIKMNPAYKNALINRGICRYYTKDRDGACEDFTRSVEMGQDTDIMEGRRLSDYIKVNCQ